MSLLLDGYSLSHMYFSSTMGSDFTFPRTANSLYFTVVSGTVNISLDGGSTFMATVVGTHKFTKVWLSKVVFSGGGVFSGYGVAL